MKILLKSTAYFLLPLLLIHSAIAETKSAKKVEKKNEKKSKVVATVNATRLNVRASASTTAEVLCQVSLNAKVEVVQLKKEWAEISAPVKASAWVPETVLSGNIVKSSACKVYAGPGILYTLLQVLPEGETVQIISKKSGWCKILPPKGMTAWVSARFLIIPPDAFKKEEEKKAVAGEKKTPKTDDKKSVVKVDKNTKKVEVLQDKKSLIEEFDPGYEEFYKDKKTATSQNQQNFTGTVTELQQVTKYATHALTVKIEGKYHVVCYLISRSFKLGEWVGKAVAVTGKTEWVTGWKRPVLEVKSIKAIGHRPKLILKEKKTDEKQSPKQ